MGTKKNRKAPALVGADFAMTPEALRVHLERKRSSAASPHVPGHRKGTRSANRRRAIAAGW